MISNSNIQSISKALYFITIKYCIWVAIMLMLGSCSTNKYLQPNEYLVAKNTIKYNPTHIENSELEAFIRQKPNRKILKLVPFNLWLYNQVNQQKMMAYKAKRNLKYDRINARRILKNDKKNTQRLAKGKYTKQPILKNKDKLTFRENILEAGEAPVILDSTISKITLIQLQKFVFSKGYFNSKVHDSVIIDKRRKRAKLAYTITKTTPYGIRQVSYKVDDSLITKFILRDSLLCLIKTGHIYDEDILQQERERIMSSQLNNGYFYFAPDYVYYLIDTNLIGNDVNVTIGIKKFSKFFNSTNDSLIEVSHPRYYVNNVYIIPEAIKDFRGKANNTFMKDTTDYNGIKILHTKKLLIKPKDLARDVTLVKGQLFQKEKAEESYKGLTSLKVFKSVLLEFIENTTHANTLDCYIVCQPIVKQSVAIETEGTSTSGNLGLAGTIIFQNKNTFKGAELVELRLKGSVIAQKQFNSTQNTTLNDVQNTFNTVEVGPQLNVYFPRPLFPFTLFYYKKNSNEKRYFTQPKTILNLSANYQSRPEFNRTITNISYGFKFTNASKIVTYDIIPLEVYSVKAKLFGSFKQDLLALNDFFLLNSFRDHATTLSKLSATFNNQNLTKKRTLMYLKATLSSSGNILRGVFKATNQIIDSLGSYRLFNIPFSQFVKFDIDYRLYFKVRTLGKVVYRLAGGIGKPLSNLSVLPYEQSFFSGGPNGIRAWRARTLGPGGYQANEASARFDKIGDVQLESNLEYRFNIFKSFYGAWFADVGNIWLTYDDPNKPNGSFKLNRFYKEIAIGSGFGVRYDFSFFILRLDAGVKIRDPKYSEPDRWTFDKQPIRNAILNFSIGYPF